MTDVFPLSLFAPSEHQPYLQGVAQMGGTPVSGPPQTADLSTGGWWVYEVVVGRLRSRDDFAAWRAFLAMLNSGVSVVEVPVLDILKPFIGRTGGGIGAPPPSVVSSLPGVPHSDLSPFSDRALYDSTAGGAIQASFAADAYAPAWPAPAVPPTQAQINITAGSPLRGGEYFSVVGPTGAVRMHMIGRVLSIVGTVSTVAFVPPLRENIPAGTPVDFNNPRFLGKADVASIKDAWPRMTPPFQAAPSIKFLESFSVATIGGSSALAGAA
jgi:hypothetical protein